MKRKCFGIVVTVGLSIIILTAGTFLASWIDALVPSYKNQITQVEDTNSNSKTIQFNKQDTPQLYPWNYYTESNKTYLTDAQKVLLRQKKVPDFIFAMLNDTKASSSEKAVLVNRFEALTVPIQDEKTLKIKDGSYFVLKNEMIESTGFYVDCAVTQDGEIVSFHASKGTDSPSDSILEHAQDVVRNDVSKGSPNLIAFNVKIMDKTSEYEQTQINMLLQREMMLTAQTGYKSQIIVTDNMVLVNRKTQDGINLIFDFDPNSLTYCGFHVQQSK